jgi:NAD-dependent dihydropyrimidine dehydrogenase PreA subunit
MRYYMVDPDNEERLLKVPHRVVSKIQQDERAKYINDNCAWGEGECIPNCPSCKRMDDLYRERVAGYEDAIRVSEAPEERFNW